MSRRRPETRLQELIQTATGVFITQGYQRTQMADVAAAMGVAKGTLYLYVESKEALFDLALRYADAAGPLTHPPSLPVPTPPSGRTVRYVRDRLNAEPASPALQAALRPHGIGHGSVEVKTILRELYQAMARNRTAIKLVDRCAADYPELAKVWFTVGREGLLAQLSRYLELGIRGRWLQAVPDVAAAARLILEVLVFWAVHRHWDPSPQTLDPRGAEDTVVQMLGQALLILRKGLRQPGGV